MSATCKVGDTCPFCGRVTIDHDHDPVLFAAAVARNEANEAAGKTFAAARDRLRKTIGGLRMPDADEAFRDAIAPHEQALDAAKDAAWAAYEMAVQS